MLINAIIKFIFSIFGLGAIMKCPANNYEELVSRALSRQEQSRTGSLVPESDNYIVAQVEKNNWLYQITYSDGQIEQVGAGELEGIIQQRGLGTTDNIQFNPINFDWSDTNFDLGENV